MSLVLGLDTSTDVRVGVAVDGRVLAVGSIEDPRAHAEQLMPLVTSTLERARVTLDDLDEIAVGVGPGPFTGLRVGVVTATTLGMVLGIPVKGVCSLDVIAASWIDAPERFVAVSDARRREVYWAVYDASGRREDGPFVTSPAHVPLLPLGGPGAVLVRPECEGPSRLDAGVLAANAATLVDVGLEPLYLRRPDAAVATTPKSTIPKVRLAARRTK